MTEHPDYPKFLADYAYVYGGNRVDMSEHDFALWRWATHREREACAQLCDKQADRELEGYDKRAAQGADACGSAIRARGVTP